MFRQIPSAEKRPVADVIVIPFWQETDGAKEIIPVKDLDAEILKVVKAKDFTGKSGSTMLAYLEGKKEKRLLFLGLGKEGSCSMESLRRDYSAFVKRCHNKPWKTVNVLVPKIKKLGEECVCTAISEGMLLTAYTFEALKSKKNQQFFHISTVNMLGIEAKNEKICNKAEAISSGVNLARDLVNGNADDITPEALAEKAREIASSFPSVKATIFDKKRIEKEGMGLFLAVSRGSFRDPVFIILKYQGNPSDVDHTVVVGKGVTFDTGGLNLKPTGSMETMKADMGGAAAALGIIQAAAKANLKINITAVVASTENGIDSKSYKPGDVYVGFSGKSVENMNTDAEGRLTLADALSYSIHALKPNRIIDLATLTGAIEIAVGDERCGLFSNDKKMTQGFIEAGDRTGEKVWEFPMDPEYRELLKSDIADLKSCGKRMAGSITAAHFLKEFVGKTPWVHLDIAGVAYIDHARRYHMTPATGFGVRLVIEMLEQFHAKSS